MTKPFIAALILLSISIPAFAKPNQDIYPVSCNELWAAVKDTLGNPGNYGVLVMDDSEQTASFTVTGATRVLINSVALIDRDNGCEMQLKAKDTGFGIGDEAAFRKRLNRSLAKLKSAKAMPAQPSKPA